MQPNIPIHDTWKAIAIVFVAWSLVAVKVISATIQCVN